MAEKYSWSSLEQTCKQIVSEQLRVDVDKLTLDTHFVNDLSADSLDEVELLMEMEEEFDVNISDEAAEESIRSLMESKSSSIKCHAKCSLSSILK